MKRGLLLTSCCFAVLVGAFVFLTRPPGAGWLADVLPGTLSVHDDGTIEWRGMWDEQRLVFAPWHYERMWSALVRGERVGSYESGAGGASLNLLVRRTLFGGGSGVLRGIGIHASGAKASAFPFLRQIQTGGEWTLEGSILPAEQDLLAGSGKLMLRRAVVAFGPADRGKPVGILNLMDARVHFEREAATLRLLSIEGRGEGVAIDGAGELLLSDDPEFTQLDITLHVRLEAGARALSVEGWSLAETEPEELEIRIGGRVNAPRFFVNGFYLIEDLLGPAREAADQAAVSTLGREVAVRAATASGYEQTKEDAATGPAAGEGHFFLSETDRRKINELLREKERETAPAGTYRYTKWGRRRKELKRAYKDEIRKLKREGVDVGKRPMRRSMNAVDAQLDEEYGARPSPEEAAEARRLADEQTGKRSEEDNP